MFFALQIAVTHQRYRFALQGVDAVQDIMLRSNLCQHDIADLQRIRAYECHVVRAAFDIRPHAYTCRREYDLLAFVYQSGYLGDKYFVRQLHQRVAS